jgi:hypothetical protein
MPVDIQFDGQLGKDNHGTVLEYCEGVTEVNRIVLD